MSEEFCTSPRYRSSLSRNSEVMELRLRELYPERETSAICKPLQNRDILIQPGAHFLYDFFSRNQLHLSFVNRFGSTLDLFGPLRAKHVVHLVVEAPEQRGRNFSSLN